MRVTKKARRDLLGKVWLFEGCSRAELDLLMSAATEMNFPTGKNLTQQGEPGRHFMVIVDGQAEVIRDGTRIAVLGPGSFFGEVSLLDGEPRVATVTTVVPTRVLMLSAGAFNDVLASMPSVGRKMLIVLANRLRDVEDRYVAVDDGVTPTDIA